MRPIDLLGIDLCEHCRPYLEPATTVCSAEAMRSYYCGHGTSSSAIRQYGRVAAVYATSDPCTMVDWKQCRLNPDNQKGA